MSMDVGVDFRGSALYVTDPSGYTYDLGAAYPVTRGGLTFGWSTGTPINLDNSTTPDARLAGCAACFNPAIPIWQADLAGSGSTDLYLGMTQYNLSRAHVQLVVKDGGGTSLLTIPDQSIFNPNVTDATNTQYSYANWPGSNAKATVSFGDSTLRASLGTGASDSGIPVWATIRMVQASAVTGYASPIPHATRNRGMIL